MPSSKHPKGWVLTTSQDYTAEGVLKLGQILIDPYDPNSAILAEGTIPVPDESLKDNPIHKGVDFSSTESHQTAFRAWLSSPQIVKIEGRTEFNASSIEWAKYKSSTIKVSMFHPSEAYAKKAIEAADTLEIPWWKRSRRVYLITGLRVLGSGTSVNQGSGSARSLLVTASADTTETGVPLSGGLGGGHQSGNLQTQSIQDSSPFVYAYRLHEIITRQKLEKPKVGAYKGGETYSTSEELGDAVKREKPEVVGYDFVKVVQDPFAGGNSPDNSLLTD